MDVGKRLRHLRKQYGFSQRELAKQAGVTNGMISQIEQGRASPSVGSLKRILDCMGLSLAVFFTQDTEPAGQVFYPREQLPDLGNAQIALRLVGAHHPERKLSVLHEVYQPGADTGTDRLSHAGEEAGVVISGQIELTVGAETRLLDPGDAYYFESRIPHRFRNPGAVEAVIVSANTPPTF
ncbi:cupin domain-containing protein [Acidihalobacter ferrooxydans]|uniref:XRE family transcriptional regulator n=1 Tax=Acidihalobacter ferrooxydans TaxID=1765967 RepID=A0A1P8UK38_9GAMM|nr:cupin domain-containing protein [Acidihalobacter ferrooxydans]APZ44164.1 XRE family transcriptional regulator [Acidihalobacter ferrooxydans]